MFGNRENSQFKDEGKIPGGKDRMAEHLCLPCTPFLPSPVPLGLTEHVFVYLFIRKNLTDHVEKFYNELTEARACGFQTERSVLFLSPHPVSHGFYFSLPRAWHSLLMSKISRI